MKTRSHLAYSSFFALLVLAAAFGTVCADEPVDTVMLVATPELGGDYSRTILLARRVARERYVGLILNRPTRTSLAMLFPDHEPSKKVEGSVFFGGPVALNALFAVVRTKESPGSGSLQLAPDLFLASNGEVIDGIIEHQADRARFYTGIVVWEPGELAAELASGFWLPVPADTEVVLRKHTEGMWEELIQRSRRVTADSAGEPLLARRAVLQG